jgi:hypothetical protein
MVSQGTGTQQKTVSGPITIHPSWCTGECWFTVARKRLWKNAVIVGLKSVEFFKWIDVPGGGAPGVSQGLRIKFVTQQLSVQGV